MTLAQRRRRQILSHGIAIEPFALLIIYLRQIIFPLRSKALRFIAVFDSLASRH